MSACAARLTGKNAEDAWAYTERLTAESRESNRWYPYMELFGTLLRHENSLVRNRAILLLAANARWDEAGRLEGLMGELLGRITDEKPVTARTCVRALPEIAAARPEFAPRIRAALEHADLSGYRDSMRPLLLKDIMAALAEIQ